MPWVFLKDRWSNVEAIYMILMSVFFVIVDCMCARHAHECVYKSTATLTRAFSLFIVQVASVYTQLLSWTVLWLTGTVWICSCFTGDCLHLYWQQHSLQSLLQSDILWLIDWNVSVTHWQWTVSVTHWQWTVSGTHWQWTVSGTHWQWNVSGTHWQWNVSGTYSELFLGLTDNELFLELTDSELFLGLADSELFLGIADSELLLGLADSEMHL